MVVGRGLHLRREPGWFVRDRTIVPSLFERNAGTVEEWTLSDREVLATKGSDTLQQTIEDHYNTHVS